MTGLDSNYRRFAELENYFESHTIDDLKLSVFEMSHDVEIEGFVHFGHFLCITGPLSGFGSVPISTDTQTELLEILKDSPFKKICFNLLKVKPELLTIITGCSCCT